ncbi:hypothetical protein [Halorarius halobius]|uniref:hypothetical protein n=1 Tax=Halorarius halobius TaxID=2962671 RepID=UPI0020CBCEB0|nr:hypothetical protein [Halorarius halobius]
MNRRTFLGALGGCGVTLAGGVAVGKPELVVGAPRGEGEPVSTRRAVADDAVEYLPEEDAVRYPTRVGADGPEAYETEPFERWARRRCASVGSEAVLPALDERFDTELEGIGKGVESEYLGLVISVMATTTRNREGEVVSEPNVAFDRLVARTPRTVRATVTLEGREHTRSVPVFVEETTVSYL